MAEYQIETQTAQDMLERMAEHYENEIKKLANGTPEHKYMVHELGIVNKAAHYMHVKTAANYRWFNVNGRWLLQSENNSEVYRTTPSTCTCPAGLAGRTCKHIIVAQVLDEIFGM